MPRAINGAALREIRELVGIDQRELAERCGVNQATISRIENGKFGSSRPGLDRRIAAALAVSVDAITYKAPQPEAARA